MKITFDSIYQYFSRNGQTQDRPSKATFAREILDGKHDKDFGRLIEGNPSFGPFLVGLRAEASAYLASLVVPTSSAAEPSTPAPPPVLAPPPPAAAQPPPPVPGSSSVDSVAILPMPDLTDIDETTLKFINSLVSNKIIIENQAIILKMLAYYPDLAELASEDKYDELEVRLRDCPELRDLNLPQLIKGIQIDDKQETSTALCRTLCNFLRDRSEPDSPIYGCDIKTWIIKNKRSIYSQDLKICDVDISRRLTSKDIGDLTRISHLLTQAHENYGLLDDSTYDQLSTLIKNPTARNVPVIPVIDCETLTRRLERNYKDLFSIVKDTMFNKSIKDYSLILDSRLLPEPHAHLQNVAKACTSPVHLIQAFLYRTEILADPPLRKEPSSISFEKLKDETKLYFEIESMTTENWDDFKEKLRTYLYSVFEGRDIPDDEIEKSLKACEISNFYYTSSTSKLC